MTIKPALIIAGILTLIMTVKSASMETWTIVDAVQRATSVHPQSTVAKAVIEEARGERWTKTALSPPVLTTRWDNIPSNEGLSYFEERRIGITQKFEFPIRYIWLAKAANLTVDQALIESRSIMLDLEAEIRQAYLEAWISSEQVRINEEYRDTMTTYSSHIQILDELSGVSRLDARRSRVKAIEAEKNLRASQRVKVTALEKLSRMTDFDLTEIELISPLDSDPVDMTGMVATEFLASNPDVLIAQSEVGISEYENKLASAAWLPELELTYFQRDEMRQGDTDSWAIEVELSLPVWFWWGGASKVREQKAQLKRAKAELATCRLELSSEYSKLTHKLKSDYEQYEFYQRELLPLADEEYRTTRKNFDLGGSNYMDIIDDLEELRDVQLENIDVISDLYERKIILDRLCGRTIINDMNK